ncbi:MAG: hypothetical protein AAFW75_17925 [Cyanobacteria bacterium J06636_16]
MGAAADKFTIMAGILYLLHVAIILNAVTTGFFCSDEFLEPIHFSQYGKTIYIKNTHCRDSSSNLGVVYVRESQLPLMKPLLRSDRGFFNNASLQQNADVLKISGYPVEMDDSSFSTIVFYNLKIGEVKTVSVENP